MPTLSETERVRQTLQRSAIERASKLTAAELVLTDDLAFSSEQISHLLEKGLDDFVPVVDIEGAWYLGGQVIHQFATTAPQLQRSLLDRNPHLVWAFAGRISQTGREISRAQDFLADALRSFNGRQDELHRSIEGMQEETRAHLLERAGLPIEDLCRKLDDPTIAMLRGSARRRRASVV